MKKLVVVDIDSTLVESPHQKLPTDEFAQIVQDLRDEVLVTCATGRSWSWAKPVLEKAKFTAPCIIAGGSLILDPQILEVIDEYLLPQEELNNIKSILKDYPDIRVMVDDYTESDYMSGGWSIDHLMSAKECYILEIIMLDHELADELIAKFVELHGVTSVKMNSYAAEGELVDIHVISDKATKEHAIKAVQELVGIDKDHTVGIGDGHNDFHIFNAVGTKVAVGNAVDDLKEQADEVIEDVSQDPVTNYLKRFKK